MLACIPTNGSAGLKDTICNHFGSAPYFTLYDSDEDKVEIVQNRNVQHSHGTCHPMNQLTRYHLDCVVCSGMGRRAIEALSFEGIKVYQAPSERVSDAVDKLKGGGLSEMDAKTACRGHGQKGGFTHGLAAGRGAGRGQRGAGQGRGDRQGLGRSDGFTGRRGRNE